MTSVMQKAHEQWTAGEQFNEWAIVPRMNRCHLGIYLILLLHVRGSIVTGCSLAATVTFKLNYFQPLYILLGCVIDSSSSCFIYHHLVAVILSRDNHASLQFCFCLWQCLLQPIFFFFLNAVPELTNRKILTTYKGMHASMDVTGIQRLWSKYVRQ